MASNEEIRVTARPEANTGESNETLSPTPTREGVRIHAINVGQGDCILVELFNREEEEDTTAPTPPPPPPPPPPITTPTPTTSSTHSYYLIDGGLAYTSRKKHLKENREACLKTFQCWPQNLNGIIVTHPDVDHYKGIKHFLEQHRGSVTHPGYAGDILITEKFKGKKFKDEVEKVHGKDNFPISHERKLVIRDRLNCYFNKQNGLLYRKTDSPQPQTEPVTSREVTKYCKDTSKDNKSSIITTIDGTNVVLTGDSTSDLIISKLNLREVKIFQVPHHGSKKNSTQAFYASFEADVYLISGGGNAKYDHPNGEVLRAIILANTVNRQRKCIIVVTNSYGLRSTKLQGLPDHWWEWVTIYHTDDLVHYRDTTNKDRRSKQWITLDPAHCPPVPQDRKFNMPNNNLIEWSPRGYIEMIRRKVEDHCETETAKPMYPFYYKCHASIKNKITHRWEPDTIIAVPAPHRPWKGDSLNQCYIRESTLDQQQVLFLRPTGSPLHKESNFDEYTYENPSVFEMSKTIARTVKELPTVTVEISIGDNSRIEIGREDNIVTKVGRGRSGLTIGGGDKIHAIYANNRPIAKENFIDCLSQNVTEKTMLLIVYIRRNALDTMIV